MRIVPLSLVSLALAGAQAMAATPQPVTQQNLSLQLANALLD